MVDFANEHLACLSTIKSVFVGYIWDWRNFSLKVDIWFCIQPMQNLLVGNARGLCCCEYLYSCAGESVTLQLYSQSASCRWGLHGTVLSFFSIALVTSTEWIVLDLELTDVEQQ